MNTTVFHEETEHAEPTSCELHLHKTIDSSYDSFLEDSNNKHNNSNHEINKNKNKKREPSSVKNASKNNADIIMSNKAIDETHYTYASKNEPVFSNEKKKKGRKSKKINEKEIMFQYGAISQNDYTGFQSEPSDNNDKKNKNENYLSTNEKNDLEKKMTVPINIHQEEYVRALQNKNKKIIMVSGPAGTGKTLFATEYGVRSFLTGICDKIVFTRPSVSVDEELGFLPGTLEEKMAPWIRPILDVLYQFISPKEVQSLMEEKMIEIAPLGYMRGRTFKNCWIVADEMQNSTVAQMKMLLTRIGTNSRLVVTGDLEQFDRHSNEINGLEDFLNKFRGRRSSSITNFEFNNNDIQREDVVKEILEIYSNNDVPKNYIE